MIEICNLPDDSESLSQSFTLPVSQDEPYELALSNANDKLMELSDAISSPEVPDIVAAKFFNFVSTFRVLREQFDDYINYLKQDGN